MRGYPRGSVNTMAGCGLVLPEKTRLIESGPFLGACFLWAFFHPPAKERMVYVGFVELFILAVGLSMDAFAVSICKGLAMREAKPRAMALVGLWFGGFQALMPLAGYLIGVQFSAAIEAVDHWLAFLLLAAIGGNMVKEALSKEEEPGDASLAPKAMVVLALATSIDALAVGVSFAFLSVDILPAVAFIGVTTFALSAVGVKVGSLFGSRYKSKAELFGGCTLILLGLKILLEHLGILGRP